MFAFNRSATAVLVPLALLLAVVLWTNLENVPAAPAAGAAQAQPTPSESADGQRVAAESRPGNGRRS